MKRGILILTVLLLNFNFLHADSGGEMELKKAIKKSTVIFSGKLIKKELVVTEIKAPKIGTAQKYIRTVYTFEVSKIFKGEMNYKTIQITTKYKEFDFVKGEKYIVYSYYSKYLLTSNFYLNGEKVTPFLATNKKSRTKQLTKIERNELRKLKKLARRRRK
jgi:hypothetical protein